MTTVRLAVRGDGREELAFQGLNPRILVSYHYYREFLRYRDRMSFDDYVLDSGAYSAMNSGVTIEVEAFADFCIDLLKTDGDLVEVFSLDVIDDWRGTLKNTEYLNTRCVPAIPTYHVGEPRDVLVEMARSYPKIALGGAVGLRVKQKLAWASECFSVVWPKPIHGFGFGSASYVEALPFHSVDSTNWEKAARFGTWQSFGALRNDSHGVNKSLKSEVEWFMRLEARVRARWATQMKVIAPDVEAYRQRFDECRAAVRRTAIIDP